MTTTQTSDPAEELVGRLFESGIAAVELINIYLGDTLGYYRALAQSPATPAELATRTGTSERYAREWLQGQAVAGFTIADGSDPISNRYTLAPGVNEVLIDELSPMYLAPIAKCLTAVGGVIPQLVEAYRTGVGVPYSDYPEGADAQAALNRPAFHNDLVNSWLPSIPDVHARLADATTPATVADLGCGAGWSTIALAQGYPHLRVEGVDSDPASLALATSNATEAKLAKPITFTLRDLSTEALPSRYDVAFFFECVHDLPRPVEALRNVREALTPGGTVIVMDENAAESFSAPGSETERFFAAVSPIWCLPQGLFGADPQPVGTLMRPDTMRALATEAGYSHTEVLDIEHPFFRFYRLHP